MQWQVGEVQPAGLPPHPVLPAYATHRPVRQEGAENQSNRASEAGDRRHQNILKQSVEFWFTRQSTCEAEENETFSLSI